ncbi:GroES-like protein [Coniochaeta ligniaria NRRL 30616]|uniref:GroES-like protein n=1 Tax=Coniochaeta ligniaria NRRL 30616 TaxID=1408157 RepID=A0A1J7JX21_9PEZI|nr:GroES-like protein [Coniochaeta ligniaria NRRL 30616]
MSSLTGKSYPVYRGLEGKLTTTPATIPALGPNDVLIRITHSGVCYSDYEYFSHGAPLALGHEGVGIVEAVGDKVTTLKPGDRTGGGFHRDSCGHCNYCLTGRDILCYDRVAFGEGDYNNGTFGSYFVGKEGYVHKIPDAMSSEDAAPLQCAGATVYSALVNNVKPRDRVGVVGVGGLGHLAIQFAAKLGNEVVVFSTTKDKEAEARGFGASEFVLIDEPEKVSAPVQVLLVTGSNYPDWNKFAQNNVLARDGIIMPFAAPTHGPLSFPAHPFFWQTYHVHSSLVASKAQHQDMLEFAARHGIKPVVQVYELKGPETINTIFEDLSKNRVRYRAVLKL